MKMAALLQVPSLVLILMTEIVTSLVFCSQQVLLSKVHLIILSAVTKVSYSLPLSSCNACTEFSCHYLQ